MTIRPKRDKISEVVGTTASENAAVNILVAGGQSETLNGRRGQRNPHRTPPPTPLAPLPGGDGGWLGWVQQPIKRQPPEELRLSRNLRALYGGEDVKIVNGEWVKPTFFVAFVP